MSNSKAIGFAGGFFLLLLSACGQGMDEREYQIQPQPSAVVKVREHLERYANGEPPASELTAFPGLIKDMADQPAEIRTAIEKAYEDLSANPDESVAIATAALDELDELSGARVGRPDN
ncbi:MAG: hypothetical protein AAF456_21620 [Planctomycetota bacterium]